MSGEMKIALIQRKQSGGCKEKPKRKNGDDSNIFLLKKTVFITVKSTSLESASENCVSNDTGLHTNSQKTHVISSWSPESFLNPQPSPLIHLQCSGLSVTPRLAPYTPSFAITSSNTKPFTAIRRKFQSTRVTS